MSITNAERESTAGSFSASVFGAAALAYLSIRRFVGWIALLLPCVLLLVGPQRTISSYYYSGMRDVFVGSLCAIGMFLLFDHIPVAHHVSKARRKWNDWTGNLAALAAFGVAFFPTVPEGEPANVGSGLHVAFSILLFVCLFVFSALLFPHDGFPQAGWRNSFHLACGAVIAAMVVAAVVGALLHSNIFWFEAVAVWAFGASFFVKGERRRRLLSPVLA